jgi:cardiolipin synthase (CMP-forming)
MPVFSHGSRGDPEVTHDRVLTIPNLISLVRVLALPFVYLDIVGGNEGRALVVLGVIASTDWVDGYIARRFDQVSRIGKLFDPISDRLLIIVVGIAMVVGGIIPLWALLVLVARDLVVLLGGAVLLLRDLAPPPVTDLGKAATFGLMFILTTFLFAAAFDSAQLHQAAWVGLLCFTLLYYLSAGQYAVATISTLRQSADGSV